MHSLPADLREVYTAFDLVLPRFHGDDSWELPLPTRPVVDPGGVIRRVESDPDDTTRPEPEGTLDVLRELG